MIEILKWYRDMGVEEVILDTTSDHSSKSHVTQSTSIKQHTNSTVALEVNSRFVADGCNSIEELKQAVNNFDGCELKQTATNTVFADGVVTAPIMFIGEAPGANEDIQGIPFCGDSGKLLDSMLLHVGLERTKNIYITNSVFWRPVGNRRPTAEEIDVCRPFVEKHIALIKPRLLVLVGATAVSAVLDINEPISQSRQRYFSYTNRYMNEPIPTAIVFHPSYLLRQPSQKKIMWFDLLKIQEFMEQKGIDIN
jgi:uracil-DNA glycosylase family 4